MSLGFKERKLIDNYLELLALSKVKRFYTSAIANRAGITTSEAFNYLLERSGKDEELTLKWELQCPNLECVKTIHVTDKKYYGSEIECPRCGFEFQVDATDFIPSFAINRDFKEYLEAEKGNKTNPKKKLKMQA